METIQSVAQHVYDYIKKDDPSHGLLDMDALFEFVEDEVLDTAGPSLNEEELTELNKGLSTDGFVDRFFSQKFGQEYQDLLLDIRNDMLSEYILTKEEG